MPLANRITAYEDEKKSNAMLELITGEALFNGLTAHYHEISLPMRLLLSCAFLLGVALLIMTLISLTSYVVGGAPFIATSRRLTRKMVSLADIQPQERVYDLGCGDGRFLIEAYRSYGASAVGVEISPVICLLAWVTVKLHGARVAIHRGDIAVYDFSDADVVFCYLIPEKLELIAGRLDHLKPGCRIISRRFPLPGRRPARCVTVRKGFGTETIYIYRVEKEGEDLHASGHV